MKGKQGEYVKDFLWGMAAEMATLTLFFRDKGRKLKHKGRLCQEISTIVSEVDNLDKELKAMWPSPPVFQVRHADLSLFEFSTIISLSFIHGSR